MRPRSCQTHAVTFILVFLMNGMFLLWVIIKLTAGENRKKMDFGTSNTSQFHLKHENVRFILSEIFHKFDKTFYGFW